MKANQASVPIIFVAHRLGGWILKEVAIPTDEVNAIPILAYSIIVGDDKEGYIYHSAKRTAPLGFEPDW